MRLDRRSFIRGALTVTGVAAGGLLGMGATESAATPCLRPPGALPEDEFLATCIRCGRCADACPNRCITSFSADSGRELSLAPSARQYGTPVIFPRRQACMLCADVGGDDLRCTAACPTGALERVSKDTETIRASVNMGTAEVDTKLCYSYNGASCGVCVRACPLEGQALRAGLWEKPIVDPEVCVGCGLCERSCVRYPQAIRVRPDPERGVA